MHLQYHLYLEVYNLLWLLKKPTIVLLLKYCFKVLVFASEKYFLFVYAPSWIFAQQKKQTIPIYKIIEITHSVLWLFFS